MSIFGPTQFSTGDQSKESRQAFVKLYFAQCVKCNSKKIVEDRQAEGCRFNGDAYGTAVFTCGDCGWKTSFHYDDASDCFYYETAGWPRG